MTTAILTGQGQPVVLAAKLGSGGEGAVYALVNFPHSVAKIYHQQPDSQKQAKLRAMVRGCHEDLQQIAAWPTDTLEQDGAVIGFVMPLLSDCQPIHHLYNPGQRKRLFPTADYAFLVHVARNVAAAFAVIHRYGHAVGDVNQGNLVVRKDATVSFIDCDSFQIRVEHKHFLCEVGVAHFTAPELQGKAFAQIVTTPDHDNFGLAVLIFHLLMMGRHPFAGVYSGEGDMPIEQAIRELRYAYSLRSVGKKMSPPPNSLSTDILSPDLSAMFERAFYALSRPTANEWVVALDKFENRLKACGKVAIHKYPATLDTCPWCYYAANNHVQYFNQGNELSTPVDKQSLPDDDQSGFHFYPSVVCVLLALVLYIFWPESKSDITNAVPYEPSLPPDIKNMLYAAPNTTVIPSESVYKKPGYATGPYSEYPKWSTRGDNGQRIGSLTDVSHHLITYAAWYHAVVTEDLVTGLMWTDHVPFAGKEISWGKVQEAFQTQKRSKDKIGGYDDWRLPTADELKNFKRIYPLIPNVYFREMKGLGLKDYIWIAGDEKKSARIQRGMSQGIAFNFNDNTYKNGGENYLIFVRGGNLINIRNLTPKP